MSGPEELRKAALESVLGWHYSPSELRSTSTIATLRFRVPPANAEFDGRSYKTVVRNGEQEEKKELSPAQRGERLLMELERAIADPNITDEQKAEYARKQVAVKLELAAVLAKQGAKVEGSSRLVQIKTERLPQETVAEILAHAGVRVGDEMTEDVARRIRAAVRQVDEHVHVSFGGDGKGVPWWRSLPRSIRNRDRLQRRRGSRIALPPPSPNSGCPHTHRRSECGRAAR